MPRGVNGTRETSRADLARLLLAEAQARRGLSEFRCINPQCQGLLGMYEAPVKYLQVKCRRCGLYSELSAVESDITRE